MTNRIHVVARAVIVNNNHILLAYDPCHPPFHYYELNKFFYYLPGGHIDFQESAMDATIREIKEETGYEAYCKNFLGILEHNWSFNGDEVCCHTHEINLIFEVKIPGINSQTKIHQVEEHVAFQQIVLENINNIDLRPALLKKLIPKWLKSDRVNNFG